MATEAPITNEEELFHGVRALPTPAEREAFLVQACAGDATLRKRLAALLQSHAEASEFLESSVIGPWLPSGAGPSGDTSLAGWGAEITRLVELFDPPASPDEIARLGHYRIEAVLGTGGMGTVFRAKDEKLGRMVAIKAMNPYLAASPSARERFIREARSAAAVEHDHVVPIYAVEDGAPVPYLVMQLVDGVSLDEWIRHKVRPIVPEIARIGREIALGLAAAHRQGLVHRDVKPGNILLETGTQKVRITDFGLARAVDDCTISQSGVIAGTPQFMSPEQAEGKRVDHRTDLFSLGTVLYALCTARPPFQGENTLSVMRQVSEATPDLVRDANPSVPEWLSSVIDRLMAKHPDERFQSAQAVADILGRHVSRDERLPSEHAADAAAPRTVRFGRPGLLAGAFVLSALFIVGAVFLETIVRFVTNKGDLVVEVNDPEVEVIVRQGQLTLVDRTADREFTIRAGDGVVEVYEKGGVKLATKKFSLERAGKTTVTVTLDELAAGRSKPAEPGKAGEASELSRAATAVAALAPEEAQAKQQAWAKRLEVESEIINSIGMKLALIPPGEFRMGSPDSEPGRKPDEILHRVGISQPFFIGRHEVTVGQFRSFVEETGYRTLAEKTGVGMRQQPDGTAVKDPRINWRNQEFAKSDEHTVIAIGFVDINAFCAWISEKEIATYRLPTETEWEYACRAGSVASFHFGDDYNELPQYAWRYNAGLKPVGQLKPNAWGLFDVHGNVSEWVSDWYAADYYATSPEQDPAGPVQGKVQLTRGGCWKNPSVELRAAGRVALVPGSPRLDHVGFRIVMVADGPGTATAKRLGSAGPGK